MSIDVIGSRYRLGRAVTCTPEATTWAARDTWLDERVLVVTPEPGCGARFSDMASALLERSSSHLLGLYDVGTMPNDFVVFGMPPATLSDGQAPREEEDVLAAGNALGDALEALHERGIVHGDLHPGSIAMGDPGGASLSPWPLAPRPPNWDGPGGFGGDPHEDGLVSPQDDLRALGAVLLGALAGPPVLSSQQIPNLEHELAGRAPSAVAIAGRALTPSAEGGYGEVAELREDCAAALAGHSVQSVQLVQSVHSVHFSGPETEITETAPALATRRPAHAPLHAQTDEEVDRPEGRRAAMVVAVTGAAVLAGLWASGAVGARPPRPGVQAVTVRPPHCVVRTTPSVCTSSTLPVAAVASPVGAPARRAPVPGRSAAPAHLTAARRGGASGSNTGPTSAAASTNAAHSPSASSTSTAPPTSEPSHAQGSGVTTTSSPTTTSTFASSTTTAPSSTTSTTGTTTSTTTPSTGTPGYTMSGPNNGTGSGGSGFSPTGYGPNGYGGSGGAGGFTYGPGH